MKGEDEQLEQTDMMKYLWVMVNSDGTVCVHVCVHTEEEADLRIWEN